MESTYPTQFEVIDPSNRTGKITLPAEHIGNTIGRVKYVKNSHKPVNKQRDFSLCLLFHSGECQLGPKCHQIHANPEIVNALRVTLAQASTCCANHGDVRSQEPEYCNMVGTRHFCRLEKLDGRFEHIQISELARTSALEALLVASPTVTIPVAKICRLHQEDRCRFGRDCKNFHLCRNVHQRLEVANISIKAAPSTSKATTKAPRCITPPSVTPPSTPPAQMCLPFGNVSPDFLDLGCASPSETGHSFDIRRSSYDLAQSSVRSWSISDGSSSPGPSDLDLSFEFGSASPGPADFDHSFDLARGHVDLSFKSLSFKSDSEGSTSPGPSSGSLSPLLRFPDLELPDLELELEPKPKVIPQVVQAMAALESFSLEFCKSG